MKKEKLFKFAVVFITVVVTVGGFGIFTNFGSFGIIDANYANAAVISGNSVQTQPKNLLSGLVGWWTFDGGDMVNNVADKSGTGNTGYLTNFGATSSAVVAGKVGQGLKFDGVNDYVVANENGTLALTSAFSVSLWAKFDKLTGVQYLISKGTSDTTTGQYGIVYIGSTNSLQFHIYQNAHKGPTVTVSIATGVWYNLSYSWDGTTVRAYINGQEVGTSSVTAPIAANTSPLQIGRLGKTSYEYYSSASIDDVRIYNRALSASEIKQLYSMGVSKISTQTGGLIDNNNLSRGLVGYWTFDGNDVTDKVYDRSGLGNNGYVIGQSTSTVLVPGKVGQGAYFLGSINTVQSYVKIPHNAALDFGPTDTYTISAWVKRKRNISAAHGGWHTIVSKEDSIKGYIAAINDQVYTNYNVNQFVINFLSTTNGSTLGGLIIAGTPTNSISDNVWHHVTYTYSGGSASANSKVYIDGQAKVSSFVLANSLVNTKASTKDLLIGGDSSGSDPVYVDEVRIYNRALSAAEVLQLSRLNVAKSNITLKPAGDSLNSGLLGHWTFDGPDMTDKVYDKSGNGNNGYVIGQATSTSGTAGKIGQALKFDGVDDYVNVGDLADTIEGVSQFSIGAWVNPSNITSAQQFIAEKSGAGNDLFVFFVNTLGRVEFKIFTNVSSYTSRFTNGITINNRWYHVVGVYDGSTVKVYVNGVVGETIGSPSGLSKTTVTAPFTIGTDGAADGTPGISWNGSIDDVRIYNRALSADEVKKLYNLNR